jgi:hypothetical protein
MSTHETPGDAHPTGVASMNLGLSDILKSKFPGYRAVQRPIINHEDCSVTINPSWIAGFASGDGNFDVRIPKSNTGKTGYRVQLRFRITRAPALPRSHPITTTGGDGVKFYLLTLTTTSSSMNKTCFARQAAAGQHNRDLVLLESLIKYLGCGRCYLSRNEATFIISTFADLSEKIIPLPLRGILY